MLSVFRDDQIAMVIVIAFGSVQFSSSGEIFLLGMPEHKMGDLKRFSYQTGICHCAVMFFVWREGVALTVETEGLVQEPVGIFYIRTQMFFQFRFFWTETVSFSGVRNAARFISREGNAKSIRRMQEKTELFFFCRTNIKKGKNVVQNGQFFPVMNDMENDAVIHIAGNFFADCQLRNRLYCLRQFSMTVDSESSLVAAFVHAGGNHAQKPEYAENVIGMRMCDKKMVDLFQADLILFQNQQNAVAAAGVSEEIFFTFF